MARLRDGLLIAVIAPGMALVLHAGPITKAAAEHQTQVLDRLNTSLTAAKTTSDKFSAMEKAMHAESSVDLRSKIMGIAIGIPGPEREAFLIGMLTHEEDAGLRGSAAAKLGQLGSEKSLPILIHCARTDRTSTMRIGDIGTHSSARRAATFAIVEFAERYPDLREEAINNLRTLPVTDEREQALYRITGDSALLKPFLRRIKSGDPKERVRGITAFRAVKPIHAPAEIILAMRDSSSDVRGWAALVLGEIGDLKAAGVLMAAASDKTLDSGTRSISIASLGRMKVSVAANLMETLLKDPDRGIQESAALALYRITGKKFREVPPGSLNTK